MHANGREWVASGRRQAGRAGPPDPPKPQACHGISFTAKGAKTKSFNAQCSTSNNQRPTELRADFLRESLGRWALDVVEQDGATVGPPDPPRAWHRQSSRRQAAKGERCWQVIDAGVGGRPPRCAKPATRARAAGRQTEGIGCGAEAADDRPGINLKKGRRLACIARILAEPGGPPLVLPEVPGIRGIPVAREVGPEFGREDQRVGIAGTATAIKGLAGTIKR